MNDREAVAAAAKRSLDMMAHLLDALAAAREHSYKTSSATNAAVQRLEGLDRMMLLSIAATLAGIMATEMKPNFGIELDDWREQAQTALAWMDVAE